MIVRDVLSIASPPLFVQLSNCDDEAPTYLKIESLNIAGSIKFKAATQIIADLEDANVLYPGKTVIESSSGNLGLALAIICAGKGYPFICVSDPNVSSQTAALIKAYGAELLIVDRRDSLGGFLQERIATIRRMVAEDPSLVWTNQYANPSNKAAHYLHTAPEILEAFPEVQALFIGAGTTGTLMGCAEYFRQHSPSTRIVAVDSVGSTLFSHVPGKRHLPGLGASRCPELLDCSLVDDFVLIPERETIAYCRSIGKSMGILLGPSSGTVLAGVKRFGAKLDKTGPVIAISPDLGDRYVDTVYCDEWVEHRFGTMQANDPIEIVAGLR